MYGTRTIAMDYRLKAFFLLVAVALAAGPPAFADGRWSLSVEPIYVSVHGHDQHVLSVRDADLGATPATESRTAVLLETNGNLAPRFELRWDRESWTFGLDFFHFVTKHALTDRSGSASGAGNELAFEVADRSFVSSSPSEVLSFRILEDTELATWTVDLYALRTLAETPSSAVRMQLGLRNADFDNDYRAVVGIVDAGGRRIDASSNYGRLTGPLVGLVGEISHGRSRFRGYIGQSLVFGEAELTHRARDFTGSLEAAIQVDGEIATASTDIGFRAPNDVAIPITEFRLGWSHRLTQRLELGAGINVSAWWDVPVPPGVVPSTAGGSSQLLENTIVYSGLSGTMKISL